MENQIIPFENVEKMAVAVAKSNLFGMKTPEQALALMLLCQSEGIHPMVAVRDYHIIQGRPTLKADAMLSRFQSSGGVVKWVSHTDEKVSAYFSHPNCPEPVLVDWDMKRAKQADLGGKDIWKKYPRQMLRARVISEGVRATYPGACGGVYTPEEVQDFDNEKNPTIEPPKIAVEAPKKAEEPKKAQVVAEAEIVPPKANTPQETAIIKPVKEAPKKKKSVAERLAMAKKQLGETLFEACLMSSDVKEEDINESNIDFIMRGMRVVFEDLQKQKEA